MPSNPMTPDPLPPETTPAKEKQPKARTRWAIRVTFTSGEDAYLRHGDRSGEGEIVAFRSRRDADLHADTLIAPGLEEGEIVTVARFPTSRKRESND